MLTALYFVLGAFLWSFIEYGLHNWVGHLGRGKNAFSREHLEHHARVHYFSPTSGKVLSAVVVLALMGPLSVWLLGAAHGVALSVGFITGYTAYEVLHRRLHTHAPWNFYGRWARKNHFYHHFSGPHANHGVTSPLWDLVFRTHVPVVQPIRVPRKQAMTWLIDTNGELQSRYQGDYVLVGRAGKRAPDKLAPAAQDPDEVGLAA